jgi:hypothetical protein
MSNGLKISQKNKDTLFAKTIRYPSKSNTDSFKLYNKVYNKLKRAANKLHCDKQFQEFAKNSKQTWSVIREILGTKKN